jgi:hypothetical protein
VLARLLGLPGPDQTFDAERLEDLKPFGRYPMKFILVLLALLTMPAHAADGIVTKPSKYSVTETIFPL